MDLDRSGPMVVACLRIADLRPRVDPLSGVISRDYLSVGLPPADAAALEHCFRVADAWSGHVVATVVTDAPASAAPVLREVAASGATVIPIGAGSEASGPEWIDDLVADERVLARTIVNALSRLGRPDLVVCGDRSADRGTGALPAFLAHELGAAQALGLVSLASTGNALELVAERRLDGGWRERLHLACPAVCSVEGAGVMLRRASLAALLAAPPVGPIGIEAVNGPDAGGPGGGAGSDPIPAIVAGPVRPFRPRTRIVPAPDSPDPRLRLLALTGALTNRYPPIVVGPIDTAGAADALVAFLVRHGYLPDAPGAPEPAGGARA
ncbi:MAG: mycofactocin-associated electron transfer flavoprotein beta subunit, partial [Acidimicrobiales bacterium]